ncbi:MAG TPA: hypothetical protein VNA16_11105, partial [Abditibacteriaceae bacterium]|nr:hypothetical protein [Abditibacteriaceae bacterium]
EYSVRLMQAVARAARPGALVCLRSIFPPLSGAFGVLPQFQHDLELSQRLAQQDRSLFCRFIRVLRVNS